MRKRWQLATPEEVQDVASRCRKEDWIECVTLRGLPPDQWLGDNYKPGTTYVIFNAQGENVALGGCDDAGQRQGLIWLIATPSIMNHQIEFLKHCKTWIDEVSRPFRLVGNMVDARNTVHVRWLQWCGFHFIKDHDVRGHRYIEFVKVIEPCV